MIQSIPQVTKVTALPDFTLVVQFDNGDQGRFQVSTQLPLTGYFAPLAGSAFFRRVYVAHGTLCWPGEIDLDPVVVHAWALHVPIELASATPA
jgi:hypothetical protein